MNKRIIFLITILILTIIISIFLRKETFINENVIDDCKNLIKKTFSDDEYKQMTTLDIGQLANVKEVNCKNLGNTSIDEVINEMRADTIINSKGQEEKNTGSCVLPAEILESEYNLNNIRFQRNNNKDFLECVLTDPNGVNQDIILETNIPSFIEPNLRNILESEKKNRKYYGCLINSHKNEKSKFKDNIIRLFDIKNSNFLNTMKDTGKKCEELEIELRTKINELNISTSKRINSENEKQEEERKAREEKEREVISVNKYKEIQNKQSISSKDRNIAQTNYQTIQANLKENYGLHVSSYQGYFADAEEIRPCVENGIMKASCWKVPYVENRDHIRSWFLLNDKIQEKTNILAINSVTDFGISTNQPNISVMIKGYFVPSISGLWTFYLTSDDASFMWIGEVAKRGYTKDNAFVKNGWWHGMLEQRNSINLEANRAYAIRIVQGNNFGPGDLKVEFEGPGVPRTTNGRGYYYRPNF